MTCGQSRFLEVKEKLKLDPQPVKKGQMLCHPAIEVRCKLDRLSHGPDGGNARFVPGKLYWVNSHCILHPCHKHQNDLMQRVDRFLPNEPGNDVWARRNGRQLLSWARCRTV